MKEKIKRGLAAMLLAIAMLFSLGGTFALAEESSVAASESEPAMEENTEDGGAENLFADIFREGTVNN